MNIVRGIFTSLLFIPFSFSLNGQDYVPVDAGSKIHFTIRNFGINTGGDFSGLTGTVHFNPAFPSSARFEATVAAATVDTDNSTRDNDLREELYFDVESFPEIKIISTRIDKTNKTDDGFYFFTGILTIKGVSKEISFPFKAEPVLKDYLFTGEFEIDRLDFGVGEKSAVLSRKVIVNLKVLAKKK